MYLLGRFKAKTLNTRSPELKARSSEHDAFVEQLRRVVAGEADASTSAGAKVTPCGRYQETPGSPVARGDGT